MITTNKYVVLYNDDTVLVQDGSKPLCGPGNLSSFAPLDGSRLADLVPDAERIKTIAFETPITLPQDSSNLFSGMPLLKSITGWEYVDASQVESMKALFAGCTSLKSVDFGSLDTSRVKDMDRMFKKCRSLTRVDMSGLDLSSLQTCNGLFRECSALAELQLPEIDLAKFPDLKKEADRIRGLGAFGNAFELIGSYLQSRPVTFFEAEAKATKEFVDALDESGLTYLGAEFKDSDGVTHNIYSIVDSRFAPADFKSLCGRWVGTFRLKPVLSSIPQLDGHARITAVLWEDSVHTERWTIPVDCVSLHDLDDLLFRRFHKSQLQSLTFRSSQNKSIYSGPLRPLLVREFEQMYPEICR